MLTIEKLRGFGADTKDGLMRCMNNEMLYLRLVGMAVGDANFDALSAAVAAGDKQAAFKAAHAIKGVVGNLSLTPLFELVSEMTELLRAGQDADYPSLLGQVLAKRAELAALCE